MKKRLFALVCAAAMAASVVTGCSGSKPAETTAAPAGNSSETTAAAAEAASTTDFPKKNVKIIVPYDAGGGVDITTRLLADAAGKDFFNGKSLVVENQGGGGAVIGHTAVANAEPDGYTIIAYTNAIVNNPILKEVTYKTEDFKTLAMVCFDPEILVVPPTSDYKTYDEFIAYAKENSVKLATPGHSSAHHIAAIKLANELGLNFDYLHNDSASVQKQQLMGGHCDVAMMAASEAITEISDGTIIGLALGAEERNENIPDVPTFQECGVELVDGAYRGFACRADVPDDVYQVLVKNFEEIATSDKFIQAMNDAKVPYMYKNAVDFQAYALEASEKLMAIKDELQ